MKVLQPGFSKEILYIKQRKREGLHVTYGYFCCKQPMSKPCLVLTIFDGRGKRKAVVSKRPWIKLKGLVAWGSEKQQVLSLLPELFPQGHVYLKSQVNESMMTPATNQQEKPSPNGRRFQRSHIPLQALSLPAARSSYHKSNLGRLSKQAPEAKRDFPREETMSNSWL